MGFLHFSLGDAPQKLQDSPSLLSKGLFEAHVPENSPFFFKINFIAIPAKHMPKSIMERRIVFIFIKLVIYFFNVVRYFLI